MLKRADKLEMRVQVAWLAVWAFWGLGMIFDLLRDGPWNFVGWACYLIPAHIITLSLLGIRRWYLREKDA